MDPSGAVSLHEQRKGIGLGMLQSAIQRTVAIAGHAGVRALLTRPIDEEASRFHQRFGFDASAHRCGNHRPILQSSEIPIQPQADVLRVEGG